MIADDRRGRGRGPGPLATIALWVPATGLAELAIAEPGSPQWVAGMKAAAWLALAAAGLVAATRLGRRGLQAAIAPAALVSAFALPFVVYGARASGLGRGGPLEVAQIEAMRNLGLGLAIFAGRRGFAAPAALLSLFLTLVSSCQADGPAVWSLVVAYAVAGAAWLSMGHWRGLRLGAGGRGDGPRQAAELLAAAGAIVLVVAVAAVGPTRAATALAGLVPSSGGTMEDDPDARSGVGDGENEVRGSERPKSVGFTDSDVYLDSDRPSLFDTFNDMYGEPIKPKMQKMVALANAGVSEQRERPTENLRGGRQFSAVRRRPGPSRRRPGELAADALIHVKGPTPLHVGLATFDGFDGREWSEGTGARPPYALTQESTGGDWFRVDWIFGSSTFAGSTTHQIKVAALDSPTLPLPPHPTRVRIGGMNRGDFYAWTPGGLLRLDGRSAPGGTVIDVDSSSPDPEALRAQAFSGWPRADRDGPIAPEVAALAASWASGVDPGWGQVEAIVSRLRSHATVDRSAAAAEGSDDVVADFLIRARRGPDYLFASSAAVLLRSLGYRARLVTGYYADPGRYDARRRQTPVRAEDVHAWAEVLLPCGLWAPIEPTPGYALAVAAPTWRAWARDRLHAAAAWAGAHRAGVLGVVVALAALGRYRREAADLASTLAWRVVPRADPRRFALASLRLVERRARRAGLRRPPSRTLARWLGPMGPPEGPSDLIVLADWALYAPPGEAAPADPREAGRRLVASWTLRRFRAVARGARRRRPEEIAA